ncbi:MAG TPA: hypothetical protein VFY40_13335 [Blastocatellia bacterium]|nr:hypothetical protein [Blastocatellia bacterium]
MKKAPPGVGDKSPAKQPDNFREARLQLRAVTIALAIALAPISVHAQNTNSSAGNDAAGAIVEQLKRATQELLDAIAPGDVAIWRKYLADDCIYTDEEGNVKTRHLVEVAGRAMETCRRPGNGYPERAQTDRRQPEQVERIHRTI